MCTRGEKILFHTQLWNNYVTLQCATTASICMECNRTLVLWRWNTQQFLGKCQWSSHKMWLFFQSCLIYFFRINYTYKPLGEGVWFLKAQCLSPHLRYVALLWAFPTSHAIMNVGSACQLSHSASNRQQQRLAFKVSESAWKCKSWKSPAKVQILFFPFKGWST